jgi:hypothetical protein
MDGGINWLMQPPKTQVKYAEIVLNVATDRAGYFSLFPGRLGFLIKLDVLFLEAVA